MGKFTPWYAMGVAFATISAGLVPAPVAAQCAFCGITPGDATASSQPTAIEIELETTLDFDRIIVDGNGGGAVRLMPDGSSDFSGSVESVGGRARIGRVIIHGEPNRPIFVSFPRTLELTGMKGTVISISALVTNLPDSPTLDSSGRLVVDFGGQLDVRGDADGEFRGNLLVRADYL
ncbi:MAG: DUF4402 domain-containing protein [Sphingomicrobium sp.]